MSIKRTLCVITTLVCGIDIESAMDSFVLMNETNLYTSLGKAIATKRNELGLTQAFVAKKIGLTRASLANIETGRQKVLLHHVYRLASALELPTIMDLIPASLSAPLDTEPLQLSESTVTPAQRAQLESVVRLALQSGGKGK